MKSVSDISAVQISITFDDKTGFILPLSLVQAGYLIQQMNLSFDKETGVPFLKSDVEILGSLEP